MNGGPPCAGMTGVGAIAILDSSTPLRCAQNDRGRRRWRAAPDSRESGNDEWGARIDNPLTLTLSLR